MSLDEPSHLPKYSRIGLEVQIERGGLAQNSHGLANSSFEVVFFRPAMTAALLSSLKDFRLFMILLGISNPLF